MIGQQPCRSFGRQRSKYPVPPLLPLGGWTCKRTIRILVGGKCWPLWSQTRLKGPSDVTLLFTTGFREDETRGTLPWVKSPKRSEDHGLRNSRKRSNNIPASPTELQRTPYTIIHASGYRNCVSGIGRSCNQSVYCCEGCRGPWMLRLQTIAAKIFRTAGSKTVHLDVSSSSAKSTDASTTEAAACDKIILACYSIKGLSWSLAACLSSRVMQPYAYGFSPRSLCRV
ncbi:hypothetical protein BD309DRAFT_220127 [Dichomitus squalens]|nr:hypothetical protein BD309DRAFT_220127 [Dichomitus squalens]